MGELAFRAKRKLRESTATVHGKSGQGNPRKNAERLSPGVSRFLVARRRSRQVVERPVLAEVRAAELADPMAESVRQRQQQPIVRHLRVLERTAHLEVQ